MIKYIEKDLLGVIMYKFQELIGKLTLEEKAALLSGITFWRTTPIARLNIPSVKMTDGPHGLRQEAMGGGIANVQRKHTVNLFSDSRYHRERLE